MRKKNIICILQLNNIIMRRYIHPLSMTLSPHYLMLEYFVGKNTEIRAARQISEEYLFVCQYVHEHVIVAPRDNNSYNNTCVLPKCLMFCAQAGLIIIANAHAHFIFACNTMRKFKCAPLSAHSLRVGFYFDLAQHVNALVQLFTIRETLCMYGLLEQFTQEHVRFHHVRV